MGLIPTPGTMHVASCGIYVLVWVSSRPETVATGKLIEYNFADRSDWVGFSANGHPMVHVVLTGREYARLGAAVLSHNFWHITCHNASPSVYNWKYADPETALRKLGQLIDP